MGIIHGDEVNRMTNETISKQLKNELEFGEKIYDKITIHRDGKVLVYKLISEEPIFLNKSKPTEILCIDEEPDLKDFEEILKKTDSSTIKEYSKPEDRRIKNETEVDDKNMKETTYRILNDKILIYKGKELVEEIVPECFDTIKPQIKEMKNYYYLAKEINHHDIPLPPYTNLMKTLKSIEEYHGHAGHFFYYIREYVKPGTRIPLNVNLIRLYLFNEKYSFNVACYFFQEKAYLAALQELSQLEDWKIFVNIDKITE